MPTAKPEQLKEKAQALIQKLAEKADTMEGPKLRALKKRIRRLQRKRRRILAVQVRADGSVKEQEKEVKTEAKEEVKTEAKKEVKTEAKEEVKKEVGKETEKEVKKEAKKEKEE